MKFSERIGLVQIRSEIQINSMDGDLRNSLWNAVYSYHFPSFTRRLTKANESLYSICLFIWTDFFKEPIDSIPEDADDAIKDIRKRFFNWDYFEVYDFIDFIASIGIAERTEFIASCNIILKKELAGYRFINGELVPIFNESEIEAIESALQSSKNLGLKGVKIHLKEALSKLSDRKNPDYRNSIKESISAVESICQKITNEPKGELGKTLKKLKEHLQIHTALEQGFIKLYGYTSDSDGIRHAMMEETNLDQEDALYMLVSCSSFINYLIAKAAKIGINLN